MIVKTSREGCKNKVKTNYGLPKFYKEYIKSIKAGSDYDMPPALYRYIVEAFWEKVTNYVIFEHGEFRLSYHLGTIRVKKMKTRMNSLKYNYGHYLKTGEKIYHLNEHTNEFYYKFFWSGARVKNKSIYKFIPNRKFLKRTLSNYVSNTPLTNLHYY